MTKTRLPIVHLPKNQWKGYPLPLGYTTEEYYDVKVEKTPDGYSVDLKKEWFGTAVVHRPEDYDFPDKLYEDWWEQAYAWGVVRDGKLLAAIETDAEEWSNRLRVTELWVSEELRKQGYGHALMELAKERARRERRRAIILETQSCNVNAIGFYEHEGFTMTGFDSCCYSNKDLVRKEVRVELGWFPEEKDKNIGKQIIIRKETPEDYDKTEEMTRNAFWNKYKYELGCDEHYLVHVLREDKDYLPELSRVAEADGRIVGTIMYSKSTVTEEDGRLHDIVTFGPLCVEPDYQGCGIGERLLVETLPLAAEAGFPCVVIFGEPDYYPLRGFKTCDNYGITTADGKNFDAFLCYALDEEKMKEVKGKFHEAPVFETLTPEGAKEFDKKFPPREVQRFPGQWE